VLVNYATPDQQFPVFLHTSSIGASLLRCKPWASGSDDCDPAFDTSRSSKFAHILCGSPDCPTNNFSGGSFCPLDGVYSVINGTFAEDVLTLAPSMAVHNFRFFCKDVDEAFDDLVEAGILDLSMDRNSLPSQLLSSGIALPPPSPTACRGPRAVVVAVQQPLVAGVRWLRHVLQLTSPGWMRSSYQQWRQPGNRGAPDDVL
jgi:hypothetical protein